MIYELKKTKNIVLLLLFIILLIIPIKSHVYYTGLYYAVLFFILLPLLLYGMLKNDLLEKRFYRHWNKRREKGYLYNVFYEGLRSTLFVLMVSFSSQFILNGRSPSYILQNLSIKVSIGLALFLLLFAGISGMVAWYEKEKRYEKMIRQVK